MSKWYLNLSYKIFPFNHFFASVFFCWKFTNCPYLDEQNFLISFQFIFFFVIKCENPIQSKTSCWMWRKHCQRMKWTAWIIAVVAVIWAWEWAWTIADLHAVSAAAAVPIGKLLFHFIYGTIKFRSLLLIDCIFIIIFTVRFFSHHHISLSLSLCFLQLFYRSNNNRNNNNDSWMQNNAYNNGGGFNSNSNGSWGGNSQPTPWNNNSSNNQGK